MHMNYGMPASEALERLLAGNQTYMEARFNTGDISPHIREKTCQEGQHPYAVIISCSDSRVIPESIFMAGIGELFVIRVAGNVMDDHQLGSVEYAVSHLGCRLVLVLGHTHCGAVDAAMHHNPDGYIKFITDEICLAIDGETDAYKACCLNVERSVSVICDCLKGQEITVRGAVYHLEDGRVEML